MSSSISSRSKTSTKLTKSVNLHQKLAKLLTRTRAKPTKECGLNPGHVALKVIRSLKLLPTAWNRRRGVRRLATLQSFRVLDAKFKYLEIVWTFPNKCKWKIASAEGVGLSYRKLVISLDRSTWIPWGRARVIISSQIGASHPAFCRFPMINKITSIPGIVNELSCYSFRAAMAGLELQRQFLQNRRVPVDWVIKVISNF